MVKFPQCTDCQNLMAEKVDGKFCCLAFPDGIPDDIFWNDTSHQIPIQGDHGIQFEPIVD